jgi:hypothetical protein
VTDPYAAGAAMLMGALIVTFLAARWYLRPEPTGKHRPTRIWTRPIEAMVTVTVRCPAEGQDRVHAKTRLKGELICRSCSHIHGGAR